MAFLSRRIEPLSQLVIQRTLVERPSDTVHGIALAVFAYLVWTLGDATAKWTLPAAGVALALLWRGVFGAATVAALA